MDKKVIDELFLDIGKIVYKARSEGLMNVSIKYEKENYIYSYLDKGVFLSKDGESTEYLNMIMSYELFKIQTHYNPDDIAMKCLFIIRSLIEPIRSTDYRTILYFSKKCASPEVYLELNHLFQDFFNQDNFKA